MGVFLYNTGNSKFFMNFKIYTRAIILNKNNDILVLKKRSDQKI